MTKELTPLEALKILRYNATLWAYKTYDYERDITFEDCFRNIEKALKALEIIKKYTTKDGIEINFLQFFGFDGSINEEVKKEFELLKEALK